MAVTVVLELWEVEGALCSCMARDTASGSKQTMRLSPLLLLASSSRSCKWRRGVVVARRQVQLFWNCSSNVGKHVLVWWRMFEKGDVLNCNVVVGSCISN